MSRAGKDGQQLDNAQLWHGTPLLLAGLPVLLLSLWPPRDSRGKAGDQGIVRRSLQVIRQMPERQVDDVAVVRVLFA
jgi:hypothetical protein